MSNAYRIPAYRPPAYRPPGMAARRLAQQAPAPRPTAGQVKATGAVLGAVSSALGAAAAWVGIDAGMNQTGLKSVAGWVVGLSGGIMGAMSLFGTIGLLLTSNEEIERVIAEEAGPAAAPAPVPPRTSSQQMPILQEMV